MNNHNLKMFHHSIIITSNHTPTIEQLHAKAKALLPHLTTEIVYSHYNHIVSFFIAPDGGKENKKVSNQHDVIRQEFIEFAQQLKATLPIEIELHVTTIGHFNDIKEVE